ncbi:hypothetical protein NDU88_001221 [Pleurodeles waltl]|uniref:Uncharacterized protein n=1 Tax=Pleurodeles waltl TaxID=8319 RepID=A0AAV7SCC3_PLEWA|nr:hypothetical protein NDU88_001221 [Pleurodeles waltl]
MSAPGSSVKRGTVGKHTLSYAHRAHAGALLCQFTTMSQAERSRAASLRPQMPEASLNQAARKERRQQSTRPWRALEVLLLEGDALGKTAAVAH